MYSDEYEINKAYDTLKELARKHDREKMYAVNGLEQKVEELRKEAVTTAERLRVIEQWMKAASDFHIWALEAHPEIFKEHEAIKDLQNSVDKSEV
jgi:hypothetical protein